MRILFALCCFAIVSSLVISCKKDNTVDINPEPTSSYHFSVPITKTLKLDAVKKAHYNGEGNRYESEKFTSINKEFNYLIGVEKGKEYRIQVYGLYMEYVDLFLLSETETLQTGQQADVGLSSKYIAFTATKNDSLVIQVKAQNESSNDQTFYLSFEEMNSYTISWKGHTWLANGDWEVNKKDQLIFKGYHSGVNKWIKLSDSSFTFYDAELDIEMEHYLEDFVGLANGNDNLNVLRNLPHGTQFKVSHSNEWECWTMNSTGSVARQIGHSSSNFIIGSNSMKAEIRADSLYFYMNNSSVHRMKNYGSGTGKFYITCEDSFEKEIFFNDITFN